MWPDPQETVDLVTFTEEILDRKLHFMCSAISVFWSFLFGYRGVKYSFYRDLMLQSMPNFASNIKQI